MKKQIVLIAGAALFFTGCSMKEQVQSTFKEHGAKITSSELKVNSMTENIQEHSAAQAFVSTRNKSLKEALEEVGRINGQNFILNGQNFTLPHAAGHTHITDYFTLKQYVEDTTGKTLVITNNKFVKNRVKVVRAVDKEALHADLSKTSFSLRAQDLDLRQALQHFSAQTGFSIVFTDPKQPSTDAGGVTSNSTKDFTTEMISFHGVNALQFLNYIEKSLDLYIEVDYLEKLVKIQKYKLKTIPLMIANRTISREGSSGNFDSGDSGGGGDEGTIQNRIEYSVYDALKNTTNEVVERINQRSGASNLVTIDENTGIVSLYATQSAMHTLESAVKNFNASYSATGRATLTVYELVVNNGVTLGSDFSFTKANGNTNIAGETTLTSTLNSAITWASQNAAADPTRSVDLVAKSLSEIGYIAKRTDYGLRIRNHVPSSARELSKTNYVKNTNTDVTSGDDPTTSTSTETEELVTGSDIMMIPKIYEDMISLYISINETTLEEMKKETFATTEINIPITKPRTIDDEFLFRDGSKKMIRHLTRFEEADKYEGIIPLKDFIIGGEKDKQIVRTELIYVLSIELDK